MAILFDGAADRLRRGSTIGLPVGASPRTVSLWFKFNAALLAAKQAFIQWGNTGNTRQTWLIDIAANNHVIEVATWADDLTSSFVPQSGYWYNLVATYDGVTTTALYINTTLILSHTLGGTLNTVLDSTGLNMGAWQSSPANFLNGIMEDVYIFGAILTLDQIKQIYNSKVRGIAYMANLPNLAGYFRMDELQDGGSGLNKFVLDSSSNQNHLTGFGNKLLYQADEILTCL